MVDVVIPTRNRPAKLARCLEALSQSRDTYAFQVYVCDSSEDGHRREVEAVCRHFSFAHLRVHDRIGLPRARNFCSAQASAPLVVSVDDDVYVLQGAIDRLVARYYEGRGWRVVAGSVAWGEDWSRPVKLRPIGYGRKTHEGEPADFIITALYLYPRALGSALGFNERITSSDDRFMGALWRSKGVDMMFEPAARARHDDEHNAGLFTVEHHGPHIYTNLFDALLVRRSWRYAVMFDVLGFAAGLRGHVHSLSSALAYGKYHVAGHVGLARDWPELRALARSRLPVFREGVNSGDESGAVEA